MTLPIRTVLLTSASHIEIPVAMGKANLKSRNTKKMKIHSSGKILAFFKFPPFVFKVLILPLLGRNGANFTTKL